MALIGCVIDKKSAIGVARSRRKSLLASGALLALRAHTGTTAVA